MMLSVPFPLSVYLQLVKIDAHVDINNLCFVFVCHSTLPAVVFHLLYGR